MANPLQDSQKMTDFEIFGFERYDHLISVFYNASDVDATVAGVETTL
jgi:hypothetical protein